MSGYAIHALLDVGPTGQTDEVSREAPDLDTALDLIRELVQHRPAFRAITLLHVEDLPLTLQGATDAGAAP